MENITYEICPRNKPIGDADLLVDGYAAKLIVRFSSEHGEKRKNFLFNGVRSIEIEMLYSIKRPLPGLLNVLKVERVENGMLHRGLIEDFGYIEIVSDAVSIHESD